MITSKKFDNDIKEADVMIFDGDGGGALLHTCTQDTHTHTRDSFYKFGEHFLKEQLRSFAKFRVSSGT